MIEKEWIKKVKSVHPKADGQVLQFIINFKPGNPTPLGMGRRALFLQKNKKISYFFTLS